MRAIRSDLTRFRINDYSGREFKGFWTICLYRIQRCVRARRPRWLRIPIRLIIAVFKKFFSTIVRMGIHPDTQIDPGLLIPHVGLLRIHQPTTIGADCAIHHVCTIGAGPSPGGTRIRDHVLTGRHSSMTGTVTIGDRSVVAAHSLVLRASRSAPPLSACQLAFGYPYLIRRSTSTRNSNPASLATGAESVVVIIIVPALTTGRGNLFIQCHRLAQSSQFLRGRTEIQQA